MVAKKKTTTKPSVKSTAAKTATSTGKAELASAVVPADNAPKAAIVRRKEMVERIVASTGKKPNEVKSVLDGVLEELGKAISAGEQLNLHPLGKVSVNRQKKFDDREVIVCKIRRKIEPPDTGSAFDRAAE